ncbi:unnamed protein product, partial [Dovyalis caffra]
SCGLEREVGRRGGTRGKGRVLDRLAWRGATDERGSNRRGREGFGQILERERKSLGPHVWRVESVSKDLLEVCMCRLSKEVAPVAILEHNSVNKNSDSKIHGLSWPKWKQLTGHNNE